MYLQLTQIKHQNREVSSYIKTERPKSSSDLQGPAWPSVLPPLWPHRPVPWPRCPGLPAGPPTHQTWSFLCTFELVGSFGLETPFPLICAWFAPLLHSSVFKYHSLREDFKWSHLTLTHPPASALTNHRPPSFSQPFPQNTNHHCLTLYYTFADCLLGFPHQSESSWRQIFVDCCILSKEKTRVPRQETALTGKPAPGGLGDANYQSQRWPWKRKVPLCLLSGRLH